MYTALDSRTDMATAGFPGCQSTRCHDAVFAVCYYGQTCNRQCPYLATMWPAVTLVFIKQAVAERCAPVEVMALTVPAVRYR